MFDFSVVIPTHNRCDFLQEAIRSVLAQQARIEIIVVDDVSTDQTPDVIQAMIAEHTNENTRIVYVRNARSLFAQGSRQRGYREASGKYVIFMDDDDFYTDDRFFAEAKAVLDANTQVNSVLGATIEFHDGRYENPVDLGGSGLIANREYFNGFLGKYPKPLSSLTAVFRKKALDAVNLAESEMVNDTCVYLWGTLHGDVYLINRPVAAYRFHGSNISNSTFSYDFIMRTLNEKNKVYACALKDNKLDDKTAWLSRNLGVSVFYFLKTNRRDIKSVWGILVWTIRNGRGVIFALCKKALQRTLHLR